MLKRIHSLLLFLCILIGFLIFAIPSVSAQMSGQEAILETNDQKWAIALQGVAGYVSPDMPEERKKRYIAALDSALAIGVDILETGGSSLDAVEQTVRFLEDNPLFNAGRGAVFTSEGKNELDAAIWIGNECRCSNGLKTGNI